MAQRKLFDKKTLNALKKQPLYSQNGDDALAQVRIFNPYGRGVIYITEYDGDDTMFGYYKDHDDSDRVEAGYFSRQELEKTRVKVMGYSLPLERDISFKSTRVASIRHPQSNEGNSAREAKNASKGSIVG